MAYSAPPTRSSANQVISADWNTYVRDNFIALESLKRIDYVQATADVTISATTAATANTIITANAFTPDGTSVYRIEFGATEVTLTAASSCIFHLYDGSTNLGRLATVNQGAASALSVPVYASREFAPSNASHTYSIRAHRVTVNATVQGGVGGADVDFPIWMRITKITAAT